MLSSGDTIIIHQYIHLVTSYLFKMIAHNVVIISNYKLSIQNDCTQCCHQAIQSSYISNTSSISNYKLFIQNDRTQCVIRWYNHHTSVIHPPFLVTSYLFKMIAHNVVIRWYNHHTSVIHPPFLITSYLFKMIAHNVVIRWYNHHTSVIHLHF